MPITYDLDKIRAQGLNLEDIYCISAMEEVYKFITMKIGQIKSGEMEDVIDTYMQKRETRLAELTQKMKEEFHLKDEETYPQIYRFDLTAFKKDDWGVTRFEPHPPYQIPYFELLPEVLLQFIGKACTMENSVKILSFESDYPQQLGRTRHFKCSRLSPTHIVGVVREEVSPDIMDMVDQPDIMEKIQHMDNPYQLFYYCLHRWPEMKKRLLFDFNIRHLPPEIKEELEKVMNGK